MTRRTCRRLQDGDRPAGPGDGAGVACCGWSLARRNAAAPGQCTHTCPPMIFVAVKNSERGEGSSTVSTRRASGQVGDLDRRRRREASASALTANARDRPVGARQNHAGWQRPAMLVAWPREQKRSAMSCGQRRTRVPSLAITFQSRMPRRSRFPYCHSRQARRTPKDSVSEQQVYRPDLTALIEADGPEGIKPRRE
jgi:hypothetical protein